MIKSFIFVDTLFEKLLLHFMLKCNFLILIILEFSELLYQLFLSLLFYSLTFSSFFHLILYFIRFIILINAPDQQQTELHFITIFFISLNSVHLLFFIPLILIKKHFQKNYFIFSVKKIVSRFVRFSQEFKWILKY